MDYLAHLTLNCGIFIILAVSLNLINGLAGQFSLGHAGFWAIGAYTGAAFSVFSPLPIPDWMNLMIGCGIGGLSASFAGALIGIPCLRLRGDYLAIATLGFSEIIRLLIINMDVVGGPRGFTNIPKWANLGWVYLWVVITIVVIANLMRGTHGRAIISIREDEIAAESIGINTFKYKYDMYINDDNYWKNYDMVHFHRTITKDYDSTPALIEKLHKWGIVTVADIDDYWLPTKEHPAHAMIMNNGLHLKIRANLKAAQYVITTTEIFAQEIKKIK